MAIPAANVIIGIDGDTAGLVSDLNRATRATKSFSARTNRSLATVDRGFNRISLSASRATSRIKGLAAAFITGFVVKELVSTAAKFQQLRIQLETVTGSADRATAAFERIKAFAVATPFEVENITTAFIRLKAIGIDPTERRMKAFADIAAAFGKDITEFAFAVTGAVTGETERLKQFGITAKLEQDKVRLFFNNTERSVKRDAESITNALTEIAENFGGGAKRQVDSLTGAFSNLNDSTAAFFDTIGQSGLVDVLTESLKLLGGSIDFVDDKLKGFNERFRLVKIDDLRDQRDQLLSVIEDLQEAKRLVESGAEPAFEGLDQALENRIAEFDALGDKLKKLLDGGGDAGPTAEPPVKKKLDATTDSLVKMAEAMKVGTRAARDHQMALGFVAEEANAAIDAERKLAEDIIQRNLTPLEQMNEKLAELASVRDRLTAQQFDLEEARITKEFKEQTDALSGVKQAAQSAGGAFSSAFEQAIFFGGKLADTLVSLERQLLQIAFRAAVLSPFERALAGAFTPTGSGGGSGAVAAATAGGPSGLGFQHGGAFRVGGVGGPDSQLVAFRATPTERVSITRPDQQGGGPNVTFINQGEPLQETGRRRNSDGNLEITLDRMFAKVVNNGGAARTAVLNAASIGQR